MLRREKEEWRSIPASDHGYEKNRNFNTSSSYHPTALLVENRQATHCTKGMEGWVLELYCIVPHCTGAARHRWLVLPSRSEAIIVPTKKKRYRGSARPKS